MSHAEQVQEDAGHSLCRVQDAEVSSHRYRHDRRQPEPQSHGRDHHPLDGDRQKRAAPAEPHNSPWQALGGGLYHHAPSGRWYERPWIDGKRTFRKLDARTQKEAREEIASRRSDQARSRLGLAVNPYAGGKTVGAILEAYIQAGYPDRHRQPRAAKALQGEIHHVSVLNRLVGHLPVDGVTVQACDRFADQRRVEIARLSRARSGARTVDLELQALSNAFNYARRIGMALANPLQHGRPRYMRSKEIRRCRDTAPASGSELHLLARTLAEDEAGEVLAWQLLFSALTGCRTSEILNLRTDALPRKPGSIEGDWLWIERAKRGVNPYVLIHPDLRECIAGHQRWLAALPAEWRGPWWFPSRRMKGQRVEKASLVRALKRMTGVLGLADRTAHGLRAYFVTVRRSQGVMDGQIAAEIGDQTVALISSTYGQVPPGWRGGAELGWKPTDGNRPFWDLDDHPTQS